jgi:hypothetical protein
VGLISQHQLSTFSSPVNGTSPIDANTVRGNDNTVKTAYNAHDADTTIHVQNGAVATRPAASIAGQMWLASDAGAVYLWLDTGSAWVDINYIRSTATSLPAGVVGSSLTSVGTLTGLTVSGTSSLQAVTATTGAFGTTTGSIYAKVTVAGNIMATDDAQFGWVTALGNPPTDYLTGNQSTHVVRLFTNNTLAATISSAQAWTLPSGLTVSAGGITVSAGTGAFQDITNTKARTALSSVSIPNNTATTVLTPSTNGLYVVNVSYGGGDHSGSAIVWFGGSTSLYLLSQAASAGTFVFSIVSNLLKVTQTTGSTLSYNVTYQLIA